MPRRDCAGIALVGTEAYAAHWAPETSEQRIPTVHFGDFFAPLVAVRPLPGDLLPVSLTPSVVPTRDGCSRLEVGLASLHHEWLRPRTQGPLTTGISVFPNTPAALRERCREIGRRAGWETVRLVDHPLAIAMACLRNATSPINALVIHVHFEGTDLALVTALKKIVRVRDQLRLRCLSHRGIDELVLHGCLGSLGEVPTADSSWYPRWLDASRLRRQLDRSSAAALELSPLAWSRHATLEVTRDDLWPYLEQDLSRVAVAARELLDANQIGLDQLAHVLLIGGTPLSWAMASSALMAQLGTRGELVPSNLIAVGAALCAGETDVDPAWTAARSDDTASWLVRQSRDAPDFRSLRFAVDTVLGGPSRFPEPQDPVDEPEYQRALQTVWRFLRNLAVNDPHSASSAVERLTHEARQLLNAIPHPVPRAGETPCCPRLDAAYEALRQGDLQEAVEAAHAAYQEAPDDPQVFVGMVDVHIQAAQAAVEPQEALSWLQCAYAHDPSNKRVHDLLAARYRQRGGELARQGDLRNSLAHFRNSLKFDPFNPEATEMAERLSAPSNPRETNDDFTSDSPPDSEANSTQ